MHWVKLTICSLLLIGGALNVATLQGKVIGVADGDTVTLLDAQKNQHKIRLQGIDAPELAQDWGSESRAALQGLALHQTVTIAYDQRDRYGRLLGHVFSTGCDHINLRLLREGMAWYYRAYACDLPASLRTPFNQAESTAQQQQQGLWRQVSPVAPWIFRNGEDAPEPVCTN